MQARRQDCRISSKPLVILVPKYGFVQIREGSWGGRLPFPDLRAHDPLCACWRLPMLFCRGTFSMSSFGRDDLSHLSMSLHMELKPDVRHVQDRVFHLAPRLLNRVEVRDSRVAETAAPRRPGARSPPWRISTCAAARRRLSSGLFPNLSHVAFRSSDKLLPGKGTVSLEEPLPRPA